MKAIQLYTVKIARHRNARTSATEYRIEISRFTGTKLRGVARSVALPDRPTIDDARAYAASAGFTATDVLSESDRVTLIRAVPASIAP